MTAPEYRSFLEGSGWYWRLRPALQEIKFLDFLDILEAFGSCDSFGCFFSSLRIVPLLMVFCAYPWLQSSEVWDAKGRTF